MTYRRIQNQDVKGVSDVSNKFDLINDTKIYVSSQGLDKTLEEAITAGDIGGGDGINYVVNSKIDQNALNYTAYKNPAQEVPTTGTGGSPTLGKTRTTTNPLVGNGSLLITKPASNVQGEGINVELLDFETADKGKIHIISFEYDASDANYNDGDFGLFFRDITNGTTVFTGYLKKGSDSQQWCYEPFVGFTVLVSGYLCIFVTIRMNVVMNRMGCLSVTLCTSMICPTVRCIQLPAPVQRWSTE